MPREAANSEKEIVFAACKRGSDSRTSGQKCQSRRAYRLTEKGSPRVAMKCVNCGHIWNVAIGGQFSM